jgi:hypothetical protein
MDDTIAGQSIEVVPCLDNSVDDMDDTIAGQSIDVVPCLDNSVDDMDDAVAGEDIELDDAGLSVSGAQLRSSGLLDDDGQLLAADRRQRLIPVRPMLLLSTKKRDHCLVFV